MSSNHGSRKLNRLETDGGISIYATLWAPWFPKFGQYPRHVCLAGGLHAKAHGFPLSRSQAAVEWFRESAAY